MIYHFNLAYLKGMSGGDRCTLEVVRYFASQGLQNTIITTDAARETFSNLGLKENELCKYITVPDYHSGESGPAIMSAYIRRTFTANKLMGKIQVKDGDILFCHNEFFPNYIPFSKLANRYPNARLIYWHHTPGLWKAYRSGLFRNISATLRFFYLRISHLFFRKSVKRKGLILSNNSYYKKILAEWFPDNIRFNISKYSGVEMPESNTLEDRYDLVLCSRFQPLKGVKDIPEIIRYIKRKKKKIKVAIIGSGEPWGRRLCETVEKYGLQENVEMKGFLDGPEKFNVIKSARLFLMTSLFESFGQVNLEAMKCGLPVVAYNLPVYEVFERGMVKVPIGNPELMAEAALQLLEDEKLYTRTAKDAEVFAAGFSWEETGREVLNAIDSLE